MSALLFLRRKGPNWEIPANAKLNNPLQAFITEPGVQLLLSNPQGSNPPGSGRLGSHLASQGSFSPSVPEVLSIWRSETHVSHLSCRHWNRLLFLFGFLKQDVPFAAAFAPSNVAGSHDVCQARLDAD